MSILGVKTQFVNSPFDDKKPITILASVWFSNPTPPPFDRVNRAIAFLLGDKPHFLEICDLYYDANYRFDPGLMRGGDCKQLTALIARVYLHAAEFEAARKVQQ